MPNTPNTLSEFIDAMLTINAAQHELRHDNRRDVIAAQFDATLQHLAAAGLPSGIFADLAQYASDDAFITFVKMIKKNMA